MKRPAYLTAAVCFVLLGASQPMTGQRLPSGWEDPCDWPDTTTAAYKALALANWGYGYDSLLVDISQWKLSPYVVVDSVGASVQGRTLFRLTITDPAADTSVPRSRVWIHARTHPQEAEGTHVTNEMISILTSDGEPGRSLRERYIFSIIPMYNPDGVELGYARQNANGIDIESNWNVAAPQPEVQTLRAQFQSLMSSPEPIKVALNMHSSSRGKRFFVFHSPVGTSELYAELEKKFIGFVQSHSPGRIEPWNDFVTWTVATALQYPESWFWLNHAEAVMALTYEDIYNVTNGGFDTTANAILRGVDDYIADPTTGVDKLDALPSGIVLQQNFPNPFNGTSTISFSLTEAGHVSLVLYDMLGREVVQLAEGLLDQGSYSARVSSDDIASGSYLYRLRTPDGVLTKVLTVMK